ncbi:MAG: hypothetical protein AAGH40_12685, partial [Verrucomicrobiota bacterium]
MSKHRHHWCAVALVGTGALSLGVVSPEELEANKPQLEISENANNLLIDWEAHPEVYYFVEGSPDLSEDSWVTAKLLKDNAGIGNLSLGTAITGSQGFYRLSQEGDPNAARLRADDDNDGISNRLEADAGMDAFSPEIATDSNGNGLPDYWESFFNTSASGSADDDGDGISNRREYLSGSRPDDLDSLLPPQYVIIELDNPDDFFDTIAINDNGYILGHSQSGVASLWHRGTTTDLSNPEYNLPMLMDSSGNTYGLDTEQENNADITPRIVDEVVEPMAGDHDENFYLGSVPFRWAVGEANFAYIQPADDAVINISTDPISEKTQCLIAADVLELTDVSPGGTLAGEYEYNWGFLLEELKRGSLEEYGIFSAQISGGKLNYIQKIPTSANDSIRIIDVDDAGDLLYELNGDIYLNETLVSLDTASAIFSTGDILGTENGNTLIKGASSSTILLNGVTEVNSHLADLESRLVLANGNDIYAQKMSSFSGQSVALSDGESLIKEEQELGQIFWESEAQRESWTENSNALYLSSLSENGIYMIGDGIGYDPVETKKAAILVQAGVYADLNRDGSINALDFPEDQPAPFEKKFYFWVNDDTDVGEIGSGDVPNSPENNGSNNMVDGMRDLVDFFPLYIDLKAFLQTVNLSTVALKLSGSSVKFVQYPAGFAGIDPASINDYLKDPAVAQELDDAATISVSQDPATPTALEASFVQLVADGKGVLLLEGIDNGNLPEEAPLTLHVYLDGSEFFKVVFPLRLDHVEKMYHHVDLTGYTGDNPNKGTTPAEPTNTDAPNWPDEQVNEKTFVFIHGYNVNGQEARGWNAEVFKRMHQLGSNARFVGVTWDGDVAPDYHNAVYRAFQTSAQVAGELSAYSNLTVAAHSLGNMIVSNAMARHGFNPDNYYLLNATTPIESYDSSQTENSSNNADMNEYMTEIDWKNYPDRLLAANWYDLFALGDARRGLTWKDRFPGVATVGHNFYSPGEDVVENARPDESVSQSAWNALVNWVTGGNIGTHAWVTQEIAKGGKSLLVTEFTLSELHGGWDFNGNQSDLEQVGILKSFPPDADSYRPRLASETSATVPTDEQLAQFGFFKRFNELGLYAPIDDANAISGVTQTQAQASIAAGDDDMQWHLLAEAIPTMSFAAA